MQNIDVDLLPGILREMTGLIGLPATMAIVQRYGGVRLYVPQDITAAHPIMMLIGICHAVTLTDKYGGETLEIPKAEAAMREIRNQEIRSQYPQLSQRELARKYKTTERNIRLILSKCETDENQMQLFE